MRLSVPGIIVSDPASIAVAVTPLYDAVASVSDAFPLSIDGPETMVIARRARRKGRRQVVGHLRVRRRSLAGVPQRRWRS